MGAGKSVVVMADSSLNITLKSIRKFSGSDYREWRSKIRQAIGFHKPGMLPVLDGTSCPQPTGSNADDIADWKQNNGHLFSILFFATEGSAHLTVRTHEGTSAQGSLGDGAAAWAALSARFDANTKEARRACREQLLTTVMRPGADPADFFSRMDETRLRLKDMGEIFPDESYEDLLLRALPKEYDFVRQTSHRDRSFGLAEIRTTVTNMYIDELSRKSSTPSVSGRGVAMPAGSAGVQCHACHEYGHYRNKCPQRPQQQKQQQSSNGAKGKKVWKKGGGGDPPPKWCSFHKTTTHSDAECLKQQARNSQHQAQANFANLGSVRLAQCDNSGVPTFGFSYSTVGGSAAAAASSTKPAADAETAIQLGPPVSEILKNNHDSAPGLFGAFGASYMTTSPALAASGPGPGSQITMMVDSGASEHFLDPLLIPGLRGLMSDYCSLDVPHKIVTAGQYVLEGIAKGTVRGHVIDVSGRENLFAFPAIVVPGLGRNLFSVAMSSTAGVVAVFDSVQPRLEIADVVLPMARLGDDHTLYSFSMDLVRDSAGAAMRAESADLWHRRMGHINSKSMAVLRGVPDNGVEYDGDVAACDVCAIGKSAQQAHPKRASYDVQQPFQLVTSDLMGPIVPEALGGFRYANKFVDQRTKWGEIVLLKTKEDAVDALQLFVQTVVIPDGWRLQRLRTDKGTEFTAEAFRKYCREIGVKLEFASTNTPQQIGANERIGRTLSGVVRCLLADSGLPHFLWGELMQTAVYLRNRVPHSALKNVTPYKTLHGKDASLGHLRAIGARAFVHVETHARKLDPRAWEGRLVGYSLDSTSFRIYNPEKRNVRESRNVVFIETPSFMPEPDLDSVSGFDEGKFTYDEHDDLVRDVRNYTSCLDLSTPPVDTTTADTPTIDLAARIRTTTARDLRVTPASPVGSSTTPAPAAAGPSSEPAPSARTIRELKKLALFTQGNFQDVAHRDGLHNLVEYAYTATNTQLRSSSEGEQTRVIPNTFKEAMGLPEAQQWKDASEKEIKSLQDLNVYKLVPLSDVPSGKTVIGTKWVYKVKPDNTFKARLVAQGWNQVPGRDCGSTFAPVCRLQSIRMVLALAAEKDWEVIQLDVKTAFLYADIEEDVFVEMAPGYATTDKNGVRFVMKLEKSLYGLAQSPLNWWKTIDPRLIEIGFAPLKSDPCVYIYDRDGVVIIITLYVDDLLVAGGNMQVIQTIKSKLMDKFKMSDMGDVSLVLGMEVKRDRKNGSISISQEQYTKSILAHFGMANCKPVSTPGFGPELSVKQPEETLLNKEDTQRYQAITGSIMYLAQITRYDVMYSTCQLARAMSKPSKVHMGAAKHLLRYLAGSTDFTIVYKKGGFKLTAFSDANWGNNPDNGKSTSCYLIMMSRAPVSFKTGPQSLTAMSTMEAELVAAALAMKEAVFCSNMMVELGFRGDFGQVPLYIDNTATLHVIGNRTYSSRTKHIALRFFYIRELVKDGIVSIHYIPTELQLADIGTKHLSKHRLQFLLNKIRNFGA